MKKALLIAITCISTALSFAQTQNETSCYVYRNDGEFNAFFFSEIDSITFSSFDIDGIEYNDIVTQEFWTPDSVYRIPIAAIDSVGFTTPQTIINSDVFPFTASHVPYIIKGDILSFLMSKSTPEGMLPQKGNIVVAEAECSSFENGIIGRVINITETPEGFSYECEKASYDDLYDQIVFHGDVTEQNQELYNIGKNNTRRAASREITLWEGNFNHKWEYSGTTTEVAASDKVYMSVTVCKTLGQSLYVKLSINNDINSSININAKSEIDIVPQPIQIGGTIKIGRIRLPNLPFMWIEPQIRLYGYFEEHGSLDLDFAAHFNRRDEASLIYSNGEWNIGYNPVNDFGVDVAKLSMKGYAEVGLMPELLFALNGTPTGIGVNSKFGIKQTADFEFDAVEYFDTGVYDAMKDTQTETYRTQSVSIFAQAGLFEKESIRGQYDLSKTEEEIDKRYLLPTFEEDYQSSSENMNEIHIQVDRDLILPVHLDMAIYDENDELVQKSNDNDTYDGSSHSYYYTFSNLAKDKTYKAYPIVKLFDDIVEMRATPAIDINKCPAKITKVECTDAIYVTDDEDAEYPNRLYFDVTASLEETDGIEEWGLYHISSNGEYKTYPFANIANSQTKSFVHSLNDSYMRVNYSSFVAEYDDKIGVYVRKSEPQTGESKTIYGSLFDYTLRYDTKPSITMSNPYITGTEIIDSRVETDGKIIYQYKTTVSYNSTVTGAFWIDYVDSGISGGNWYLTENPLWYPTVDNEYQNTWYSTYWDDTDTLSHSVWKIIHIRNSGQTINSNYLNHSGSGTITSVWCSSSQAYASRRSSSPKISQYGTWRRNYVEATIPEPVEEQTNNITEREKTPLRKGGFISVF